ncbi:hypothetical protein D1BOALGB6SA_7419 [Olavius sp. associated proteobacterium Delta 1]|nr:hypothetical protein D1BOALGB6SA_7419 [Olavius sp. associated proteobacterium Delta 1]
MLPKSQFPLKNRSIAGFKGAGPSEGRIFRTITRPARKAAADGLRQAA